MRLEFVPFPLLVGLCILVLLLAILHRHNHRPAYLLFFSAFWAYLLIVVSATVFPIPLGGILGEMGWSRQPPAVILSRVNLVPFYFGGLFSAHPNVILHELAGNILLTMPFGFGIRFIADIRAKQIPWLALAVGLGIETTQLLVSLGIGGSYRGVDINDVLLNAAGVLIGFGIFKGFHWTARVMTQQPGVEPK